MSKDRKNCILQVLVTASERDAMVATADRLGVSLSSAARSVLLTWLNRPAVESAQDIQLRVLHKKMGAILFPSPPTEDERVIPNLFVNGNFTDDEIEALGEPLVGAEGE